MHPHYTSLAFPPQVNNKALLLSDAERRILNYGPKFVPQNPKQTLQRLENEINLMKEKVAVAWRRETKTVGRNPEIVNRFSERIEQEIRTTISKEKIADPKMLKILGNLKKAQKEQKVIFRQTDKSKVFHLGKPDIYIEKSAQYMSKMNAYKEIDHSPLEDMIKGTEGLLIDLVRRKLLPSKYLEKLRPSQTDSELPHLYYNPKDHKIGEPLRPIVAGIKSPISKISSFLDQILRPIFDRLTPYNLTNSIDLLHDLKKFQTNEKTKLYTFDITDLYTSIPQHESVMAICEMLGEHNIRKVNGDIPINTIRILLKHVLNNSYFTLQLPGQPPKFFQQTRGGAMGSACTQVLADVYVKKWEKSLVEQQEKEKELYRRFRDDVFLTTQKTIEEMNNILIDLGKKDPNIQLTFETGQSIDYLDIKISVEIPSFRTKVYRKLAAQPYILPFHSSHPLHIFKNIPFSAMLRATRICSHVEDLKEEIKKIRIILLLNKYPPTFIDAHINRFYETLTGKNTPELLFGDQHKVFREKSLDPQWNKRQKRKIDFNRDVLIHFTYTPSLAQFGAKFHQIWDEIFEGTPLGDIPVTYAHRLTDNLSRILINKKPPKSVINLLPQ
jgi:hypothetical protein